MKKSDENCNMSGSGERNNQSFILIRGSSMFEVTEVSIAELRKALESGQTTAVELVKAYLARIDAYNGPETQTKLNAVVVRNP